MEVYRSIAWVVEFLLQKIYIKVSDNSLLGTKIQLFDSEFKLIYQYFTVVLVIYKSNKIVDLEYKYRHIKITTHITSHGIHLNISAGATHPKMRRQSEKLTKTTSFLGALNEIYRKPKLLSLLNQ